MDQPICLYLRLEQGQHPDIDVVAEASSAFAQLIREVAFIVDPSAEIRIEFESATEGSLSLNAIVRYVKQQIPDPAVRWTVLGVVLGFLTREVISAIVGILVNQAVVNDKPISDEDVKRIATEIARLVTSSGARSEAQQIYRVIGRDRSITGVGATFQKGTEPSGIIPRDEFHERAGYDQLIESAEQTRAKTVQDTLVLVSPVLELEQRNRKWRFLRHGEAFIATMDDTLFLQNVLTGRSQIPMVAGIELDAVLGITETKKDGLWTVTDRRVLDVRGAAPPRKPDDLFGPQREP